MDEYEIKRLLLKQVELNLAVQRALLALTLQLDPKTENKDLVNSVHEALRLNKEMVDALTNQK